MKYGDLSNFTMVVVCHLALQEAQLSQRDCTVYELLSLISQNLNKSCDSQHIPFEGHMSRMTCAPVCQLFRDA